MTSMTFSPPTTNSTFFSGMNAEISAVVMGIEATCFRTDPFWNGPAGISVFFAKEKPEPTSKLKAKKIPFILTPIAIGQRLIAIKLIENKPHDKHA